MVKLAVEADTKKRTAGKELAAIQLEAETSVPSTQSHVLMNKNRRISCYPYSVYPDGTILQSTGDTPDEKTKKEAKCWIHVLHFENCWLNFKIYSLSHDATKLRCPKCEVQNYHAYSYPSSKQISELWEA